MNVGMYVCTHLCMYVCMYVWVLQYRLQIHEERLGRKRKHSEFCGIITMYVYIRIYYMHLMYVCMHGMANCVYVVVLQETEQLLVYPHGKITCSVPLRGSIPLKGSSPVHMKYEPIQTLAQTFTAYICLATFFKVSRIRIGFTHVHTNRYDPVGIIDSDRRISNDLAAKHICEVLDIYSDNTGASGQARLSTCLHTYIHTYMLLFMIFVGIIFINLVDNKKDQGKLGVAFKVCTYVCMYVLYEIKIL